MVCTGVIDRPYIPPVTQKDCVLSRDSVLRSGPQVSYRTIYIYTGQHRKSYRSFEGDTSVARRPQLSAGRFAINGILLGSIQEPRDSQPIVGRLPSVYLFGAETCDVGDVHQIYQLRQTVIKHRGHSPIYRP